MEKKTNGSSGAFYASAAEREPRAVADELLDRMEAEGFGVAMIAFMTLVGDVQVATSSNVEVRSFIRYLCAEWLPSLDAGGDQLLGN